MRRRFKSNKKVEAAIKKSDKHLISNMSGSDIINIIKYQLETVNYIQPTKVGRKKQDHNYYDNKGIWEDVILESLRANTTISLNNFFIIEWFPRSPGLYHTAEGYYSRREAKSFVRSIEDGITIYKPHGKSCMLDGGIGNIRLRPKVIDSEEIWFMTATSNGVCHEGFPIALPKHLYNKFINEIADQGAILCNLVGELKFIPTPIISIYGSYTGVPQLYLLVNDIKPKTTNDEERKGLYVSIAVSFLSKFEGRNKAHASYVYFFPNKKESFKQAVEWMEDTYVKGYYHGTIITDFDEQMYRFKNAPFSLNKIMNGKLDEKEVIETLEEIDMDVESFDQFLKKYFSKGSSKRFIMVNNVAITLNDGSSITGNINIASIIKDSFNTIHESDIDHEIKSKAEELTKQISEASTKIDDEIAATMSRDVKSLSDEITSSNPRNKWYNLSLEGIKEAAEKIGEIGKPILETVSLLVPILEDAFI